jgi:hypothetical protein
MATCTYIRSEGPRPRVKREGPNATCKPTRPRAGFGHCVTPLGTRSLPHLADEARGRIAPARRVWETGMNLRTKLELV